MEQYREWLGEQEIPAEPKRKEVAEFLLGRGRTLAGRIEAGIAALNDAQVLEAFRLANKVMAMSARKRNPNEPNPAWRPFQLAFLLLNLDGMADPTHADRELVDLLFFPTGGGKTEAYLGLSAFTMFLRRLRNPGVSGAGVTVIMRYTLRLLTLDQLGRAAALMCAMELERQKDVEKLGTWPFEIGLWVGQAATPNEMGKKGDKSDRTARARTRAFKRDERQHGSPIRLDAVYLRDVGMVQRREHLGFALETGETHWILRDGIRKNLDGYFAIELCVFRAVHLTHSTRANGRKDFVLPQACTGG